MIGNWGVSLALGFLMTLAVEKVDILIVGAGPTGLGAATRLQQHNHASWLLVEAEQEAGGLACTDVTSEGFLFDMGGHVIFSHYAYFDELLDSAVGTGAAHWNVHERVSYIWLKDRWIPYPFQNNLYALDAADKQICLEGLIDAYTESLTGKKASPVTFDDWIVRNLGEGIANVFMRPYNYKVWAYPPSQMQAGWLGERVATVDLKTVVKNVVQNKPAVSWGPNALFRFPQSGGTGGIWKKVAAALPAANMRFNMVMTNLDLENKQVHFSDSVIIQYNKLLLTTPLNHTLRLVHQPELAETLTYSSTHVIGLGLRGTHTLDKKCWLYFPSLTDCVFYRCTVFSNYAAGNCPADDALLSTIRLADGSKDDTLPASPTPGPYWSLMFEVSESAVKEAVPGLGSSREAVIEATIQGAVNCGLIERKSEIVSIFYRRLEQGYPTPHVDRDGVLQKALPLLKSQQVWSRGRFGSWKYEVANQDHSLMLGVEAVDNMLFGTPELTLEFPDLVNRRKNAEPTFAKRS